MDAKCSFCGRERNEVFTFFRPQDETQPSRADCIYICDRCIESCHKQLAAKRNHTIERVEKQQLREWLHESVTETLTRAIVDLKYRDALLTAFAERAQLAKIDPSEPPGPRGSRMAQVRNRPGHGDRSCWRQVRAVRLKAPARCRDSRRYIRSTCSISSRFIARTDQPGSTQSVPFAGMVIAWSGTTVA